MYVKPGDSKNKEEMRVIANWGDTLWSLAEDYSVSADEIRRANNMSQVLNLCFSNF
jgi:LysM repeat protein